MVSNGNGPSSPLPLLLPTMNMVKEEGYGMLAFPCSRSSLMKLLTCRKSKGLRQKIHFPCHLDISKCHPISFQFWGPQSHIIHPVHQMSLGSSAVVSYAQRYHLRIRALSIVLRNCPRVLACKQIVFDRELVESPGGQKASIIIFFLQVVV